MDWASGNPGFALTDVNAPRDTFPTLSSDKGYKDNCVRLVTRATGEFGIRLGMPIDAGNLFMGTFDILSAVTNALKATKFGMPFEYVPTYLTGYYKYKAGPISPNQERSFPVKKICSISMRSFMRRPMM